MSDTWPPTKWGGHPNVPRPPEIPEGKPAYYYSEKELGAVFGRRSGWEQPYHYGDPIAEHHIIRNHVGLIDCKSIGNIWIEGKEALEAVQRLYTADMDVPVGSGVFCCLCDENGGAVDDAIIWRLADDTWLTMSTTAGRQRHHKWVKEHIKAWDLAAVALDITDGLSYLQLGGPRSRDVVEMLTEADVSNEALPFLHIMPATIAGVEGYITRAGFTGELCFEFYVGTQYGEWVWNKTLAAVKACGGGPAGIDALVTCAFEKGFTVNNLDYNAEKSPLEGGIGFTVDLNKPYNFIGKEALINLKKNGLRKRNLGFRLDDKWATAERGDRIFHDDEEVGHVLWCMPALTLEIMIGRAEFAPDIKVGLPITIKTRQGDITGVTHSRYFYDPNHERLHS
jgi:glycine cleavage system aminomethyltransferase T